jgi:TolA-binding protein
VERQENELLRSIVLKQLRRQAQMKQAKELLLTQLDRVGARSDTLLGLVEDMARGSQLSEEEKALFKAPQFEEILAAASAAGGASVPVPADAADAVQAANTAVMSATLIAPGNGPSPAGVSPDGVIEKQKLTVELAQIDKAARLDFKEGRHAEAEAGFLEYLRYLPQNVPCLCNLGVLKITMKNYSEAEYYLGHRREVRACELPPRSRLFPPGQVRRGPREARDRAHLRSPERQGPQLCRRHLQPQGLGHAGRARLHKRRLD